MTVCIAALCEKGTKIVVCADRMMTIGMLSREFEHTRSKIVPLPGSCVMMTAGPALRDIELQKHVSISTANLARVTVPTIVDGVKDGYQQSRLKKIEELYLRPRGLTLSFFHERARGLLAETAISIEEALATFDYELEILVAGIDNEGAHIYLIMNPGSSECFDNIGYHVIGSGEPLALSSLIESGYSDAMGLQETMWAVYEAKKRSENAPGVGKAADFTIIQADRTIPFNEEALAKLEELYTASQEDHAKCFENFRPRLNEIPIPK